MKKSFVSFLVVFSLLFSSLCAVEWGGIVNDETSINSSEFKDYNLSQSNAAYLWLTIPFTEDSSWKLSTEAMYKYTFDLSLPVKSGVPSEFISFADLDLFKLSGIIEAEKGTISLDFGRFFVSDITGMVFSQNSDGFSFSYSVPAFKAFLYGGYTGLLNGLNVTMLDATGSAFENNPQSKIYDFSHGFIPVIFNITLPGLFANQTLSFESSAFFDLKEASGVPRTNTFYGALSLGGPLSNSIYYSLVSTVGSQNFKNIMNYTSLGISIFPADGILISAGAKYASGKELGMAEFRTITSQTAYNSFEEAQMTNVILPTFGLSFAGLNYYVGVNALAVLQLSQTVFHGVQGSLSSTFNVFSDFSLGADICAYYDVVKKSNNNYKATVRAVISF